jgi:uncharacterized protein
MKTIKIKVIPNAKHEKINRMADGRLKVKVSQPREEYRANRRAKELLAEYFQVSSDSIRIIKGSKSENKIVEIIK